MNSHWNISKGYLPSEHDGCAIICYCNKVGRPTHGNLQRTIEALVKMGHRAGEINGEGDGCGVLTDIPRLLWREALEEAGRSGDLAESASFALAHLLVPREALTEQSALLENILQRFAGRGLEILTERPGPVRSEALSANARRSEPFFWQIALRCPDPKKAPAILAALAVEIERETPVHVASLSGHVAAYKVHGAPEILPRYYPELKRRDFLSSLTIGHSRYSTNTLPTVLRAQPFGLLAHNGEINTIERLRDEARMMGVDLPYGGSDSQDLNRLLEGLMFRHGFSLFAAMEMVFPPIFSEMDRMPAALGQMYGLFRRFLSASAQGPAAVIARYADRCVFSVDALGLRPLWFGETEEEIFASSELGVVPHSEILSDPRPLSPGEKVGIRLLPGKPLQIYDHGELIAEVLATIDKRTDLAAHGRELFRGADLPEASEEMSAPFRRTAGLRQENLLAANAWKTSDLATLRQSAAQRREPITSLGYDGPLAALSSQRQNISDFFKEQVAVVTNPAIDREREMEHFSTRVMLGPRPVLRRDGHDSVVLEIPFLTGGRREAKVTRDREAGREAGTCALEDLLGFFSSGRGRYRVLSCALRSAETVADALERLRKEALAAVSRGSRLLLLDDGSAFTANVSFLDPGLAVAVVHRALRDAKSATGESLRRRTSLVVRSGALRNLHDLVFLLGMGADALCPYLMWELADAEENGLANLLSVVTTGLEKVISTMGTHELGGYGRYFASVGLAEEVAEVFGVANFCGSAEIGLTFRRLEEDGRERRAVARSSKRQPVENQFRIYSRIWKMVGQVSKMEENFAELSRLIRQFEIEHPLAVRHLVDFRFREEIAVDPEEVDVSIGNHDLPILISAMSFGSQGETPFRIYAESARRLNIICMNGEGGEIADMLGKFRQNRGQQIASGRFGVTMEYLNSVDFLEIKVGQGAKPGEGGHLPGFKVTEKIAAARHAVPGVSLISPSNNHDIYSIEDLAQIIEELRTANPHARISVKVPSVAGIGTISLGIAKAGADIITISGYDGGTGAARRHAVKFVGFPVEIGVREAHCALVEAGLRNRVEIWADGGAKTGRDVVKLLLLGANRVGFGTMAMVVIGCTACRGCHMGTCHVGIATQIETDEEAREKGLKRYVPRVLENGIIYHTTFFRALGREIRTLTAKLGFQRTQDLVGQAHLLEQVRGLDRLDLSGLLAPPPPGESRRDDNAVRIIRKPLNYLTSLISGLVTEAFDGGDEVVHYNDGTASSSDRAIGTYLAGALTRAHSDGRLTKAREALLHFRRDSTPGNGLGAFTREPITIYVEGGAQDGVGKSANGGRIIVLKGENRHGVRVGGSVGKGLAYGAQGGTFLIQGDADSRACIRLSGADVVLGGRIRKPLDDSRGLLADRANLKGFAFEYMTAGRVVVLGDPGPWICSGMTGGVVYCRLDEELGLDRAALRRRIARGATVEIRDLDENDVRSLEELLLQYHRELLHSHQEEEADWLEGVLSHCRSVFVKIVPEHIPAPLASDE
ncbi:MAG: glutamate synthase [Deltaproteobacteria bacterium]|nr:glutamate synthase [Deltaproteobacteria bacterium]TLN02470.1 MAG: glutamate synthase [bacterium]